MKHICVGYEQRVGAVRAPASLDPERDPSPVIQELIARTKFIGSKITFDGKAILDYGCGTGVALQWIRSRYHPGKMVGLDISKGAIESAKSHYPGIDFRVLDMEKLPDNLQNTFDVSLCFEVLEHLLTPGQVLSHIAIHYMKSDGILIATTPNRKVFSGGMKPSPINKTHIREMNLDEFSGLLKTHFKNVHIYGMRFKDPARTKAHGKMVEHACDGYKLFGELWWNKWVRRFYRWILRGEILLYFNAKKYLRWKALDFEFVDKPLEVDTAVWFLAIVSNRIDRI